MWGRALHAAGQLALLTATGSASMSGLSLAAAASGVGAAFFRPAVNGPMADSTPAAGQSAARAAAAPEQCPRLALSGG
jgi:hypothetical protein